MLKVKSNDIKATSLVKNIVHRIYAEDVNQGFRWNYKLINEDFGLRLEMYYYLVDDDDWSFKKGKGVKKSVTKIA